MRPPGESDTLEVPLQPNLPDGTYSATYRIISADSFPVSGGVVFSIGAPSGPPSVAPTDAGGTGTLTDAAFWVDRCSATPRSRSPWARCSSSPSRGGRRRPGATTAARNVDVVSAAFGRRVGLLVGAAIGAGVLASLGALPLQGASATGRSIWDGRGDEDGRPHPLRLADDRSRRRLGAARRDSSPPRRPASAGARAARLELMAIVALPVASLLVSPRSAVTHVRRARPPSSSRPTSSTSRR